jgi:hypothetical protein
MQRGAQSCLPEIQGIFPFLYSLSFNMIEGAHYWLNNLPNGADTERCQATA